MARGSGWWGTPPLMVGAAGLLLLAFGSRWTAGVDEVNEKAQQQAAAVAEQLKYAESVREVRVILLEAEGILKAAGHPTDLLPMLDAAGKDPGPALAEPVRNVIYEKLRDRRDPAAMIAGRIAFYFGLAVVFLAGVLLYRRTPGSNQGRW